ncbi:MAG: hypothetical protein COX77_01550 [Candidatus Komeilibacteria bacterium CG_4_10_14_0_2_um_filter_37_10]|uniref:DUF5666 domain-containing protein n=1 Tax=Candidatus Komeilibacteria bacterium CG_4_10_14_0_2_um_filter_37_10 TaxID=1974470 RepID=A0A2M7VFN2_9BACT|nr:MAG: hypothetical protein COX77_01550 [Candidatus Komeilibacteria bacterium CG_4_10_14_0_2_um_filter_37_10]PJA92528.1 MAG: hypothetical protein CO133_02720 [Candidatus Komeilibacteria bacterium CG_4_9_14_3_um_filter_37_5]
MKKANTLWIVTLIVVAGGFFGLGTWYGKTSVTNNLTGKNPMNQTAEQFQQRRQQFDQQFGGRMNGANNFINGEIISQDDKTITIKLQDSGSAIVFLSTNTKINKMADGSLTDLAVGKTVMISGTKNQDGSIIAQSIQLRPDSPTVR